MLPITWASTNNTILISIAHFFNGDILFSEYPVRQNGHSINPRGSPIISRLPAQSEARIAAYLSEWSHNTI